MRVLPLHLQTGRHDYWPYPVSCKKPRFMLSRKPHKTGFTVPYSLVLNEPFSPFLSSKKNGRQRTWQITNPTYSELRRSRTWQITNFANREVGGQIRQNLVVEEIINYRASSPLSSISARFSIFEVCYRSKSSSVGSVMREVRYSRSPLWTREQGTSFRWDPSAGFNVASSFVQC